MEIPDFKTFEEFFEYIKGIDHEFVMENRAKLADYFDLQNWSLTEYSRLSGYVEKIRDWRFRQKFEVLENFNEFKPFIYFEEFFEWAKNLNFKVILENNVAFDDYFTLRVWQKTERKKWNRFVTVVLQQEKEYSQNHSTHQERIGRDALEFEKIPDVDTIENDEFEPEKLEEEESSEQFDINNIWTTKRG